MDSRELDIRAIRRLVKEAFPELLGFHVPVRARVVAVHEDGGPIGDTNRRYSVDVQPLKSDGSVDEESPVIPDVELPVIWAGPHRGVYCLPEVGAIVRLAWDYGDPSAPFVAQVLGMGYVCPNHDAGSIIIQHSTDCFVTIDRDRQMIIRREPDVEIRIDKENCITIKAPEKVTVESETEVCVSAPAVRFGVGPDFHPVAFADVVAQVFNDHTHPTPRGASGPPKVPMDGHQSDQVCSG